MFKEEMQFVLKRAKRIRNSWYPYLRNIPIEIKTINGHSNYTKFVILGRGRVGSNLLRSLLNNHSQITTFGEVFRDTGMTDWDHMEYFHSQKTLYLLQNDPAKFIRTCLFGRYPGYIAAVGFKIFYYHVPDTNIWPYLKGQKDIKIIHLKRKNMLKTYFSLKKAELTNIWVNTSEANSDNSSIFLKYEDCLKYFVETQNWQNKCDALFSNHNKIDIVYEELVSDFQTQMKDIQQFLGVDYEFVTPATSKQSKLPLNESISNYYELKEKFKATPWAEFFKL